MIHIYHPNKAVKGFACSFWFSERDNCIYATIIKQSGWDEKNQNGIFRDSLEDPNRKVNIKLSNIEVCAILDCIERNRPFNTFHAFGDSPKQVSFVPWMQQLEGNSTQRGFSFTINVNNPADPSAKNSFYIGLKYDEARYVREYLLYALNTYFERRRAPKTPTPAEPAQNTEPAEPSNQGEELI